MVALEGTMGSPSSSSMDVGEWMHLPGVVPYGAAAAASIRIRGWYPQCFLKYSGWFQTW